MRTLASGSGGTCGYRLSKCSMHGSFLLCYYCLAAPWPLARGSWLAFGFWPFWFWFLDFGFFACALRAACGLAGHSRSYQLCVLGAPQRALGAFSHTHKSDMWHKIRHSTLDTRHNTQPAVRCALRAPSAAVHAACENVSSEHCAMRLPCPMPALDSGQRTADSRQPESRIQYPVHTSLSD
jgi:hypothetical protein